MLQFFDSRVLEFYTILVYLKVTFIIFLPFDPFLRVFKEKNNSFKVSSACHVNGSNRHGAFLRPTDGTEGNRTQP